MGIKSGSVTSRVARHARSHFGAAGAALTSPAPAPECDFKGKLETSQRQVKANPEPSLFRSRCSAWPGRKYFCTKMLSMREGVPPYTAGCCDRQLEPKSRSPKQGTGSANGYLLSRSSTRDCSRAVIVECTHGKINRACTSSAPGTKQSLSAAPHATHAK